MSVLAVAIAIALLLVLVGLSNGTLNEVSRRMESVEAEIVVRDRHFDIGSLSGGKLWEKEIPSLREIRMDSRPAVRKVIPVFIGRMKLAGLSQNVFGINPEDFPYFAGTRKILSGQLFADFDSPLQALNLDDKPFSSDDDTKSSEKNIHHSLPLVIDRRLSQASVLKVGDTAFYGGSPAHIVGIVETGVAGRVFAPINRLRGANGIAKRTAHMFFIKADPALQTDQLRHLCDKIEKSTRNSRSATLVANYGQVLADNFRNLTIFVSLVSVIALIICFLFILVTMYTMVLERGREIAILQSLGAGRSVILRQTLMEAALICSIGTVLGIALTFGARWLIETVQPLMTIEIRIHWLLLAILIGLGGGCLSALYPGYLALCHDPVETLSFE